MVIRMRASLLSARRIYQNQRFQKLHHLCWDRFWMMRIGLGKNSDEFSDGLPED